MNPLLRWALHFWHWLDLKGLTADLPSGAWGERWATRYLRLHGCRILGCNVRPCRHGELDIIAKQGRYYLFVEVKTRKNEAYGAPIEAVHARKRQLMRRCATQWLSHHFLLNDTTLYRFDAIEVVGEPQQKCPDIRWVQAIDMQGTRRPEV